MSDSDAASLSVSHWGIFPYDEMAIERATDELFAEIYGKPNVKCSTKWRDVEALAKRVVAAYKGESDGRSPSTR